jgi:hypothetical protein
MNFESEVYLHNPLIHKLGKFCEDRTVVLQMLEAADQHTTYHTKST